MLWPQALWSVAPPFLLCALSPPLVSSLQVLVVADRELWAEHLCKPAGKRQTLALSSANCIWLLWCEWARVRPKSLITNYTTRSIHMCLDTLVLGESIVVFGFFTGASVIPFGSLFSVCIYYFLGLVNKSVSFGFVILFYFDSPSSGLSTLCTLLCLVFIIYTAHRIKGSWSPYFTSGFFMFFTFSPSEPVDVTFLRNNSHRLMYV